MHPQPSPARFNMMSAVAGFALGAVLTMVATINVLPREVTRGTQVTAGQGGGGFVDGEYFEDGELGFDGDDTAAGEPGFVGGGATGTGGTATGGSGGTEGRAGGRSGAGGVFVEGGGGSGGTGDGTGGGGGGGDAECAAGRNGGATDTGITGTEIKLGATVAETGIARSFLGEVRQGMEAVRNKVNRAGGICGRQLRIEYRNDAWDPVRGATFIQNLVEQEKVFALAVSPSSEGLNAASRSGYLSGQGVPVVGADGLNRTQFSDPMIFPVSAATTTTVHVMMKYAWDRGAKNPAIVFGNTYRFGVEGAEAFNNAYKRLSGNSIPGYTSGGTSCSGRFCGVRAGETSYNTQVNSLNTACNQAPKCDFLLLLLEPSTAQTWMASTGAKEPKDFVPGGISGPQPLFTFGFGRTCGDKCQNMLLWTGYNPPIEQYESQAPVRAYVSDLKAQSGSADEFNQFTMGGYIGMQLLVKALEEVGPNLTREALLQTLNSMPALRTGLTAAPELVWRPNSRHANHSAQAFQIRSRNGFAGWQFVRAPMRDPWLGQ